MYRLQIHKPQLHKIPLKESKIRVTLSRFSVYQLKTNYLKKDDFFKVFDLDALSHSDSASKKCGQNSYYNGPNFYYYIIIVQDLLYQIIYGFMSPARIHP